MLSAPELARALGLSEAEAQQVERDVRKSLTQSRVVDYRRVLDPHGQVSIVEEGLSGGYARRQRGAGRQRGAHTSAVSGHPQLGKLSARERLTGKTSRRPTAGSATRRSGARSR
jgi:hypothetical protein